MGAESSRVRRPSLSSHWQRSRANVAAHGELLRGSLGSVGRRLVIIQRRSAKAERQVQGRGSRAVAPSVRGAPRVRRIAHELDAARQVEEGCGLVE